MVRIALIFLTLWHFNTVRTLTISKPSCDPDATAVCNTPECVKAAYTLIRNMDPTADPCEDFYQYACGGYVERIRIPDSESSKSQFGLISDKLKRQLRAILESNDTSIDTSDYSKVFYQARDHYQACMNLEKIEEIGRKPLLDTLRKFGGWPVLEEKWDESAFDWEQLLYKFRESGYSSDLLFDFSIGTDLMNSTWRTIGFDQPSLSLSREYLLKGLKEENVGHYFDLMQKVAILLGADPERAKTELEQVLKFEMKLASASKSREERRNAFELYNPMTLVELNHLGPYLNWTNYVNTLLKGVDKVETIYSNERVIVYSPSYLTKLTDILAEEPKQNLANYMLWKVALSTLSYLDKASRDVIEDYARNVSGKKDDTPRWRTCVSSAAGSFSAAIGKPYVMKHFNEESKETMLEMVADIKDEFKDILKKIDWMDRETKEKANAKLGTIKKYIGYPKEILENKKIEDLYKGLTINKDTFYQNSINMGLWSINYHWSKLREEIDKTDWKRHSNPAVVNAYYNALENSIQFPAGILQGVFFDKDRPKYMNYASIGWVIGHEITHGFDDQGKNYNAEGNLQNWWGDETNEKYEEKAKCIINQYGNFSVKELKVSLNGVTTQGENIADNGGLKEAYNAYEKWVERNGEEQPLPGFNLNSKQLFWLSGANIWCSKYRPKTLKTTIKVGSHAPGMFRVKGSLSNSQEFARDFNCPLGSTYNPQDKCQVW